MSVRAATLTTLDAPLASRFADLALANVGREYPAKLDHVLAGDEDARPPRTLHPAFHGSFDWHSCVHAHWLLARVRRLVPALPGCAAIDALFDRRLTPAAIAGECAYLARPEARTFERTYGWAWLLALARELLRAPDAGRWSGALAPLANAFVRRYEAYLPRQQYPIRSGLHANSAFGLAFALDYARGTGEHALAAACVDAANRWFAADRNAPAGWEPSGADFLSPALMEANLIRRVLAPDRFADWLHTFLPGLADAAPATLFAPATVGDRADPQLVHLDGLNLSRAWCMREIAGALPGGDARAGVLRAAADAHFAAGMAGLDGGEYAGTHWLATFALLAATPETAAGQAGAC
jgi:Protein of unknown function (DUF2891)